MKASKIIQYLNRFIEYYKEDLDIEEIIISDGILIKVSTYGRKVNIEGKDKEEMKHPMG